MAGRLLVRPLVAAGLTLALAGCWPAPGQGPDRRSHNPVETRITVDTVGDLTELWRAATGGAGDTGPPVVSAGSVHVTDTTQLVTFAAATGARRWSTPEEPLIVPAVAPPLVDGSRLLVSWGWQIGYGGSWNSGSAWYDVATGADLGALGRGIVRTLRGTRYVATSILGNPTVASGTFLDVGDTADPAGAWRTTLSFSMPGSSVVGWTDGTTLGTDAVFYAGAASSSFEETPTIGVRAWPLDPPPICDTFEQWPQYVIRCTTWFTPTAGTPVGGPVIGHGEDVLYVVTDAGELLALDAGDGSVLWSTALGGVPSAMPALDDDTLFIPLDDGRLVAVPSAGCGAATCPVAWSTRTGGAGLQPAVAGGVVVVATDAGTVRAFDADGCGAPRCRALWGADIGVAATGAPAVSGGRVFVGTAGGGLVAFG
jgi:outer membrane protein assembly factor BamB